MFRGERSGLGAKHRRAISHIHYAAGCLFFVNGAVVGAWAPYIPERAHSLGLNIARLGATLLGGGVGAVLAMPLAAWLIARQGSGRVSTVAGIIFPLSMYAAVVTPSKAGIVVALTAFGLSGACMDIGMNAEALRLEDLLKRRVMSGLHGAYSVGGALGALLTSSLLAHSISPRSSARATAISLGMIVLLAQRWMLPKHIERTGAGNEIGRPNPRLLFVGALVFFVMVAEGAVTDWSAIFLRDARGYGAGMDGLGFAGFSAAMLIGRLNGDRVIARFGERLALQAGGLLGMGGLLLVLLGHGHVVPPAGFSLLGLGLANSSPVLYRAAGRVADVRAGVGLATAVGIGYIGLLIGPPLLGLAGQAAGLSSIFLIVAGLCGLLSMAAPKL